MEEDGQVAYSRPSKSHRWPILTRNYLPDATAITVSVRYLLLLILSDRNYHVHVVMNEESKISRD